MTDDNIYTEARKQQAQDWFRVLRDRLCDALEACEDDTPGPNGTGGMPVGRFERTSWSRGEAADQARGGGDEERGGADGGG
ncbi:MAG: hypothetical protein HQ501_14075, partial [Rhodospirillales bacterium]|nr:hypothetical protein [Rhodospirillales bacterium]